MSRVGAVGTPLGAFLAACSSSSAPLDAGADAGCPPHSPTLAACIDAGSVDPERCACTPVGVCPPCPSCARTAADPNDGHLYCDCCLCGRPGCNE